MATTTQPRDESQPCCPGVIPKDYKSLGKDLTLGDMRIYVVDPPSSSKNAVIVSQDIFGIDSGGTREFCDKLAAKGFVVIMGDYFRGNAWKESDWPAPSMDAFMEWVNSFKDESLSKDLETLRAYLTDTKKVDKIGALGFCWGGKTTVLAAKLGIVQAAVTMHGAFIKTEDGPEIKCPILMIDAGDDPDRTDLSKIVKAHPEFGSKCDFVRYEDMEHGWVNRGDRTNARVNHCMNEAFDKAVSFFNDCLK